MIWDLLGRATAIVLFVIWAAFMYGGLLFVPRRRRRR